METVLLQAMGIAKSFNGVAALRNGCLELGAGSVHALCGGNGAGKSTFLSIVMGLLRRDGGSLRLRGREVDFASPLAALNRRIAMITQELSPVPGLSVAENLTLGREPRLWGALVDRRRQLADAEALLQRLDFDLDPRCPMSQLSLAQTQLVEIAKAFNRDSDILIMDEPTSSLGERETEALFAAVRRLAAHGAGIIYVSHRLSEIFEIADCYTVFRDGAFVESGRLAEIDRPHLVSQIVGRELRSERARRPATVTTAAPLLQVEGLGRDGEFKDISLVVHPGEIVGIYGLLGSGRSELLNCLYGLSRRQRGSVRLAGRDVPASPAGAIRAGLALVTEDRKDSGLVLSASVADNIAYPVLPRLARGGVVRRAAQRALVTELCRRLRVKTASPNMPTGRMSGGNQQKVVLARCLAARPRCLLCDEPTRGIDEGAKREVYAFLDDFAREGGAVLLVSSEAPEILELSDRIAVFKAGRLVAMLDGAEASQQGLLHLAS
ncbi:sugar ABC transporter ATP-binding protein [Chromobacterium haemolyticum]|uniref:sugar ABC transporter ATP-binding protein n=1 Tax=Chromobacterium haemolyticum TaxID=394935 RepID=UPI00307FA0C9